MLLNPTPDKASADLIKVFLCSSHTIVACLIGYGLALTAAFMATHYQKFRLWGLGGGIVAVVLAITFLWDETGKHYFGPGGPPDPLSVSELIQLDWRGVCARINTGCRFMPTYGWWPSPWRSSWRWSFIASAGRC